MWTSFLGVVFYFLNDGSRSNTNIDTSIKYPSPLVFYVLMEFRVGVYVFVWVFYWGWGVFGMVFVWRVVGILFILISNK